jgi:hypothetical protein
VRMLPDACATDPGWTPLFFADTRSQKSVDEAGLLARLVCSTEHRFKVYRTTKVPREVRCRCTPIPDS